MEIKDKKKKKMIDMTHESDCQNEKKNRMQKLTYSIGNTKYQHPTIVRLH